MNMDENKDLEIEQELDIIEMTDEEGNTILMEVLDYFFYNGEEYVILSDTIDEDTPDEDIPDEIDCYIMKVITYTDETGEELESFEPIEDADLEAKLIEIANNQLNDDPEEI